MTTKPREFWIRRFEVDELLNSDYKFSQAELFHKAFNIQEDIAAFLLPTKRIVCGRTWKEITYEGILNGAHKNLRQVQNE